MMPQGNASTTLLRDLYRAITTTKVRKGGTAHRKALEALEVTCTALFAAGSPLEVLVDRHRLYLNGKHITSDIDNFAFYRSITDTLGGAEVGKVTFHTPPKARALGALLRVLVEESTPEPQAGACARVVRRVSQLGVRGVELQSTDRTVLDDAGMAEARASARRAYDESLAVSRELFTGARLGRIANVGEVRSAIQNIVDAVLNDETALGGLSALRNQDAYTFTHAVNTCIFCVAIGRRLGLNKSQLYDLGHAALVHDIGMGRVPRQILSKVDPLTTDERRLMEAHTSLGALAIFRLRDHGDVPLRSMTVAYEHHLAMDGGGYPVGGRKRTPSVFSRIVAVASAFDAATNERAYSPARPADQVLRELRTDASNRYDPVIVKALINLLGIYPVGTVVILDSYELAIVHAASPDPVFVHRPVVRLLSGADGRWIDSPPLIDLAAVDDEGRHPRSIIKVTDPERYGIDISAYLGS